MFPVFLSALLFSQADDKMTIDHENEEKKGEECLWDDFLIRRSMRFRMY